MTQRTGRNERRQPIWKILLVALAVLACAQAAAGRQKAARKPASTGKTSSFRGETTRDYNQRIEQLLHRAPAPTPGFSSLDYRIGPEDLLEISVFEAPSLDRTVRVTADGEISMPLLGNVRAAGLTSRDLEMVLQELLRRTYMKDPHVSVFVKQMESHPVSVFGAVQKPGVYQVRGPETLIEVLSRAQGLAQDAGDSVIVMRHGDRPAVPAAVADASGAKTAAQVAPRLPGAGLRINLKKLLDSGDPRLNVLVDPGDVVTVTRAGIVYVVGEVKKPGGFLLKTNENISVLQALALAEGLTRTSAAQHARIIRTDLVSGRRIQIPINLKRILAGKAPDPLLRSKDIVFVPNSAGKAAFYRGAEAALSIAGGVIVYRR